MKSRAIKINRIFIFLLVVLFLKWGGALFCSMENPAALWCYPRKVFFIKVPWDFSEIGPVGGIGIVIHVSAFGENLFA